MKNKISEMNNLQNKENSTVYDEKHIEESLREFANILFEYVMSVNKNVE